MFSRHWSYGLVYVLLASACALSLAIRARHSHQTQPHSQSPMSSQQALDRSIPLCRAIAPQLETQNFSVESCNVRIGDWWCVSCKNAKGKEVANLNWDAHTGELAGIGAWQQTPNSNDLPLMSRRSAVAQGWYWIQTLGFAAKAPRWQLTHSSLTRENIGWFSEWATEGRRVSVMIDAHSGDLLSFTNWQPRSRIYAHGTP